MQNNNDASIVNNLRLAFDLVLKGQTSDRESLDQIATYLYPYCLKTAAYFLRKKKGSEKYTTAEDLANFALAKFLHNIKTVECDRGFNSFTGLLNRYVFNEYRSTWRRSSPLKLLYDTEIVNDRKSAIPAPADIVNSDSPKALALAMHYIRSHVSENKLAALTTVLENPDSEFRSLADHLGVNYRTFKSQFYRACEQLEPHKATLKKILGMDSDANEKTSRRGR